MKNFHNEEKRPVLYDKKEECCGCGACFAICPKQAIHMVQDDEGFLYPNVNERKCVKCYLCESVCIFKRRKCKKFGEKRNQ